MIASSKLSTKAKNCSPTVLLVDISKTSGVTDIPDFVFLASDSDGGYYIGSYLSRWKLLLIKALSFGQQKKLGIFQKLMNGCRES